MLLRNFFLQVFSTKPRLVYMSPTDGPAPEKQAEALKTTLETLTNQQIINLTTRLDGNVALSGTEIKILTKLGIMQGLDTVKRKATFSGDTTTLVQSREFGDFLKALQRNPELYSKYQKLVAASETVAVEARTARDQLREVVTTQLRKTSEEETNESANIELARQQAETEHEQTTLSTLEFERLSKQRFKVPTVLRTGNPREWANHFQSLDTGGAGLQTAEQILIAEPFNWSLNDFKQILQKGGFLGIGSDKKIKFDDIIRFGNLQGVTATNGKRFMEEYAQMKSSDYLEAEIADWKQKSRTFTSVQEKTATFQLNLDIEGNKWASNIFSLKREDEETMENWLIRLRGQKEATITSLISDPDETQQKQVAINQHEQAILLVENQQTNLQTTKEERDTAQAKIAEAQGKLQRYQTIITKSLDLFDALSRLQEGEQQVDVETSSMTLDAYSQPEQHAIDLTYQAFSGEDLDITQADLEAGTAEDNIESSTALTRLMSWKSARQRLITRHSKFEGEAGSQKRVIDHQALTTDLQNLMLEGLRNSEKIQPPVDLVDIAESLGIKIGDALKTEIKTMQRELNQVSRKERRLSEKSKKTPEDETELTTLRAQRENLATELGKKNRALITIIENNPAFKTLSATLTDAQRLFIQFGMYQRELTERGMETAEDRVITERDLGNLETRYKDNPIILSILQEIQKQKPELSSEQLETIAESVQSQLDKGFNMETYPTTPVDQSPGGQTADSRMLGGLSFITQEGKGLTATIPTININLGPGASIQLSLMLSSNSPIPMPVIGETLEIIDTEKVDLSVSMQISGLGASASTALSLGRPDRLNFYIGGGGQITCGIPGWHVGTGLYMSPQGRLENYRETEQIKAGDLSRIAILPRAEKIAAIRALPQFQGDIEALKEGNPPITNENIINEILLTKFEHLMQEVGTNADADVFIFPLRGAGVALINPLELLRNLGIPIPKGWDLPATIPMVFVTLAFKGGTKIMPFIDRENQLPFLVGKTDAEIGKALMETMHRQADELIGQVSTDLETAGISSRGLQVGDGGRLELDGSEQAQTISADLGRSIEDYNKSFAGSGITFGKNPTYKGNTYQEMLHLQFAKNRFLGTVELHVDDQTEPKIHILRGNPTDPKKPATLDDLYLSFDRMDGRLIIETRDIQLARPDRFGNTIKTIITIKTNPHRSRTDIERDDTGYLLFAHDKSVVERKESGAAETNNILTWEEAERLRVLGLISEMETPLEYTREINRARGRMEEAISGPKETAASINTSTLDTFAEKYMAKDSKEFKELSTMIIAPDGTLREANRPALIAKLQELANADTTIKRNLNETELNYTINRLIVLSFHQHKSPEALKKTVERFFRPKLTKLFEATKAVTDTTTAESFANAIIDAIDFASLDLETATSATTLESDTYALTIVGTEGIEGLRGMVNLGSEKANIVVRTGNILEKISEGQRDTYKSAMLEMSSKLPGKNETRTEAYEFLRSPLAIKLADYASILLGPKHSDSLAELYKMKSPETIAALLATEKFRQVYDTFRALVDQFRDVQITGKEYMVWKNMDGYTFVLKDLTEYGAGVHKKCANPTLLVHEEFAIARLNGRIGSVTAEAVQRAEYKSGTHIYELFAGLAVKPEEEKPVEEKGGKGPKVKGTKDKLDPGSFDRDIGEFEGGGTDQPDEGSGIFD